MRHKMRTNSLTVLIAVVPLVGTPAATDAPLAGDGPSALMVGDPAPPLRLGQFVKGDPFSELVKGKIYLIEFWASWCPPCIEGMPTLTALQEKYKDKGLVVLAVTKADPENTLEMVSNLVAKKAEAVGYSIAMDDGRATVDAWLKAAGQREIPCAFIVNREGTIAHILQPDQEDLRDPVEQIVAGNWDLAVSKSRFIQKMRQRAKANALNDELARAKKAGDWSKAIALCDDLLELNASENVDAAAEKFRILLIELKNYPRAYAFGREAVESIAKDDARTLNRIAFPIVDPELKVANRDLDLALRAAQRANELKKGEGPYVLNTLARIQFVKRNVKEAVDLQAKALSLADREAKAGFEATLAEYKRAGHP